MKSGDGSKVTLIGITVSPLVLLVHPTILTRPRSRPTNSYISPMKPTLRRLLGPSFKPHHLPQPPAPPHLTSPTPSSLQTHLLLPSPPPILLPQITSHWPALTHWTPQNNLGRLTGIEGEDKVVGVELGERGQGYLDGGFRRVEMPLGESLSLGLIEGQVEGLFESCSCSSSSSKMGV